MEHTPFFSVCIPVYNAEAYLVPCIESVLAQTEQSFEILLGDAGSRDGSAAICDAYASRYPNIRVLHKKNEGPMLARHAAAGMARGNFLTFLDSDDLFVPHTLRRLQAVWETTAADLILFDLEQFFPDGRKQPFTEAYRDGTVFEGSGKQAFLQAFVTENRLNSMCRKCIRRELYDAQADLSAYAGVIQGEDKLASLHCLDRARRIVYCKECLYLYRMNPQSTSHNLTLKNYRDIQLVQEVVTAYIRRWQLPKEAEEQQWLRRLHVGYVVAVSLAGRVRQGKTSRQELQQALAHIAADPVFFRGWEMFRSRVGLRKRLVCGLIRKQAGGRLCLLCNGLDLAQRLFRL